MRRAYGSLLRARIEFECRRNDAQLRLERDIRRVAIGARLRAALAAHFRPDRKTRLPLASRPRDFVLYDCTTGAITLGNVRLAEGEGTPAKRARAR